MQETAEQVTSAHLTSFILTDDGQSGGSVRRLELERPVGAVPVVVLDVDPKGLLKMAAPDEQQPVQALGADGADHRSAYAFAVGARTGVASTWAPSERNTSSKLRQNFASRSWSRKRTCRPRSPSTSCRLRACWVTQALPGWAVTPARCTRRVSSSMKNSTESRRSQTVSAVRKSHATIPAACRRRNARQVVAVRRGAGSSPWPRSVVRIAVAEPCTPSRRWPGGLAVRGDPRVGDQPPVPAQRRLRLDGEAGPAGSGQHAADRGEQGSVGGLELETLDLAAEDVELVTQDQELQVLGGVTAGERLDGAVQREGGEFRQHQVSSAVGAEAPRYRPRASRTPAHGSRPRLRTPHAHQGSLRLARGRGAPRLGGSRLVLLAHGGPLPRGALGGSPETYQTAGLRWGTATSRSTNPGTTPLGRPGRRATRVLWSGPWWSRRRGSNPRRSPWQGA